jgi:nicotinate-nucleotide adenylyltransferase
MTKEMKPEKRVGLLGGSFNPAHKGHLHITKVALKKLKLDEVWWLVTPQNPLKPAKEMAPLSARLKSAEEIISSAKKYRDKIIASDMERKLATVYTSDTIQQLKKKYPKTEFIWLMGADNLIQLDKWHNWERIPQLVEVHVFDRGKFYKQAMKSPAYLKYSDRITYHKIRKSPLSSSFLRKFPIFNNFVTI